MSYSRFLAHTSLLPHPESPKAALHSWKPLQAAPLSLETHRHRRGVVGIDTEEGWSFPSAERPGGAGGVLTRRETEGKTKTSIRPGALGAGECRGWGEGTGDPPSAPSAVVSGLSRRDPGVLGDALSRLPESLWSPPTAAVGLVTQSGSHRGPGVAVAQSRGGNVGKLTAGQIRGRGARGPSHHPMVIAFQAKLGVEEQ